MRILTTAQYEVVDDIFSKYPYLKKYHGWLNTPFNSYSFSRLYSYNMPIACDNSAYSHFSESRYLSMIDKITVPVLWITLPDKVADPHKTNELWDEWINYVDHPLAYVGQDGCEDLEIPWEYMTCFFIGGTTDWKLSNAAADLAKEANLKNKWVHMGRVNSDKRLSHAYRIGCDSVDGTGYSKFSKKELLKGLLHIDGLERQLSLF